MTGLEIIRAPGTTAEQIADIIAEHCPPVTPEHCDKLSCRECWHGWPPASPRRKRGRPTNRRPRTRKGCTPTSSSIFADSDESRRCFSRVLRLGSLPHEDVRHRNH